MLNVTAYAVRSVVDVEPSQAASSAVTAPPKAKKNCPDARKAVRFYQRRYAEHRAKMGAGVTRAGASRKGYVPIGSCPRYLASVWKRKAHGARVAYLRWHEYHYAWWKWLPMKHQRVGACETGDGKRPGDFSWDSGRYVSFAGIYRPAYDDDAHRVGNLGWDETKRKLGRLPTPREQMQAVDSHRAAHGGWSGWGCRGA